MFYIKENDKIVLFDNSKQKLQNTLIFMPQYKDSEILETEKNIIEFKGKFYFEDDSEYLEQKEAEEQKRISELSLTKREVFLALYRAKGITPEQIRAQIKNPEALIEFDYANDYFRGNPLIDVIGQSLGYTAEQLDYLFKYKELPTVELDNIEESEAN